MARRHIGWQLWPHTKEEKGNVHGASVNSSKNRKIGRQWEDTGRRHFLFGVPIHAPHLPKLQWLHSHRRGQIHEKSGGGIIFGEVTCRSCLRPISEGDDYMNMFLANVIYVFVLLLGVSLHHLPPLVGGVSTVDFVTAGGRLTCFSKDALQGEAA